MGNLWWGAISGCSFWRRKLLIFAHTVNIHNWTKGRSCHPFKLYFHGKGLSSPMWLSHRVLDMPVPMWKDTHLPKASSAPHSHIFIIYFEENSTLTTNLWRIHLSFYWCYSHHVSHSTVAGSTFILKRQKLRCCFFRSSLHVDSYNRNS